jgi:AbrB family looped-hinge helix DNA binding protein
METVTVSSRFQVVIPRAIREALRIRPGHKFQVIQYENRIELIPLQSAKELRSDFLFPPVEICGMINYHTKYVGG